MKGWALQQKRASMAAEEEEAASRGGSQPLPPSLLLAPPAEVLGASLSQQLGPLPLMAPITRMKRRPSGCYQATENREQVLGRRRAANAKERERIKNLNSGFSQLKSMVPLIPKDRKPSKADMLRATAEYIRLLRAILKEAGGLQKEEAAASGPPPGLPVSVVAEPPEKSFPGPIMLAQPPACYLKTENGLELVWTNPVMMPAPVGPWGETLLPAYMGLVELHKSQ
ncbi:factor in the germline alpha [Erythrolamprus reginae]|uniref:factor in the germline alpha n=1 Tax=Erythrolamprus reginae TaxID=121349 RepID=UPI00396CC8F4